MMEAEGDIRLNIDNELLLHGEAKEVERGSPLVHFPHVVPVPDTEAEEVELGSLSLHFPHVVPVSMA